MGHELPMPALASTYIQVEHENVMMVYILSLFYLYRSKRKRLNMKVQYSVSMLCQSRYFGNSSLWQVQERVCEQNCLLLNIFHDFFFDWSHYIVSNSYTTGKKSKSDVEVELEAMSGTRDTRFELGLEAKKSASGSRLKTRTKKKVLEPKKPFKPG